MGGITHSWSGTVLTVSSDSGTSSADLKGAKGDDGARGAQGAVGIIDTNTLNNYIKKVVFVIEPQTIATIKFNHITSAIISATGTTGKLYGTFVYNAYGTGGAERVHIAEIQKGSALEYSILDVAETEMNGIILSNTNLSNKCYVSIALLYGDAPTITYETLTTEEA